MRMVGWYIRKLVNWLAMSTNIPIYQYTDNKWNE